MVEGWSAKGLDLYLNLESEDLGDNPGDLDHGVNEEIMNRILPTQLVEKVGGVMMKQQAAGTTKNRNKIRGRGF